MGRAFVADAEDTSCMVEAGITALPNPHGTSTLPSPYDGIEPPSWSACTCATCGTGGTFATCAGSASFIAGLLTSTASMSTLPPYLLQLRSSMFYRIRCSRAGSAVPFPALS